MPPTVPHFYPTVKLFEYRYSIIEYSNIRIRIPIKEIHTDNFAPLFAPPTGFTARCNCGVWRGGDIHGAYRLSAQCLPCLSCPMRGISSAASIIPRGYDGVSLSGAVPALFVLHWVTPAGWRSQWRDVLNDGPASSGKQAIYAPRRHHREQRPGSIKAGSAWYSAVDLANDRSSDIERCGKGGAPVLVS